LLGPYGLLLRVRSTSVLALQSLGLVLRRCEEIHVTNFGGFEGSVGLG